MPPLSAWPALDIPSDDSFDACLFDCDGTLIHSMPLHRQAWNAALRACGIEQEFPKDLYEAVAGMETARIVSLLNQRLNTDIQPEDIVHRKRDWYLAHLDGMPVVPPVASFARRIAQTHPIAVVSGGMRSVVRRSLVAAGLDALFDLIVTFEDVPRGKPAPDMFLFAAEKLGIDPRRCLVFEDGQLGIDGALEAGMRVVRVPFSA